MKILTGLVRFGGKTFCSSVLGFSKLRKEFLAPRWVVSDDVMSLLQMNTSIDVADESFLAYVTLELAHTGRTFVLDVHGDAMLALRVTSQTASVGVTVGTQVALEDARFL